MTKVVVSDAHGNEVTVDTDASLAVAERTAARLYDRIRVVPAAGPGGAGQVIGFRSTDPDYVYLRNGGRLEVT